MKTLTALVLIIALAGCASTGAVRASQVAYVGTQVLDIHSTQRAISRGAVELNPIVGDSLARQLLVKSAATALILAASEHIQRQGHRKVATALLAAMSIAYMAIVAHNYQLNQGHR